MLPPMLPVKRLFFFSSRRRHTRFDCDWSSDVCSSDLVYVPNVRLLEEVARYQREAVRAAGTVCAATWRRAAQTEARRRNAAADVAGKAGTRKRIQNRSDRPAVKNVLGRPVIERSRVVHNAGNELLPAIEV